MLDFFMRLKRIQLKSLHTTPMLTSTIFTNPIVHHMLLNRPYVQECSPAAMPAVAPEWFRVSPRWILQTYDMAGYDDVEHICLWYV